MDPLTGSIVVVLGKYALEKGSELGKEIGPKALETAKEMFGMVLDRVKKVDPRTADKFPDNPEGYKAPLADALDETLQAEPDLAAQLKEMLAQYEQAAKEHAQAQGTTYRAKLEGDGAIAQGAGAVAAGAGGVAVGGDVHGDVVMGSKTTTFDQRGQQVESQTNVAGDYVVQQVAGGLPPLDSRLTQGWNVEAIRQMLMAAFSDGELTTLCFDRFQAVYENFGGGVSKGDKVRQLMDYCFRQGQMEALLSEVERRNPAQYRRFAGRLRV